MRGVDMVRAEAKRAVKAQAKKILAEERAKKLRNAKVRREALSKVAEYTEQCIQAAKDAARKDSRAHTAHVRINDSNESWVRGCYVDAVTKVVKKLLREGLSAKMTWTENHGYFNSETFYEYHYQIGVQIVW